MVAPENITFAELACQQSNSDKVRIQVEFLLELKGEKLVSETILGNYRKTPAGQRGSYAVYVDKAKFRELLEKAKPKKGAGAK